MLKLGELDHWYNVYFSHSEFTNGVLGFRTFYGTYVANPRD